MSNENDNSTLHDFIKVFIDSPALLVIVIIVYIFTTVIGGKLDTLNDTLTENIQAQSLAIERFDDEAEDTLLFIEQQKEVLKELEELNDRLK